MGFLSTKLTWSDRKKLQTNGILKINKRMIGATLKEPNLWLIVMVGTDGHIVYSASTLPMQCLNYMFQDYISDIKDIVETQDEIKINFEGSDTGWNKALSKCIEASNVICLRFNTNSDLNISSPDCTITLQEEFEDFMNEQVLIEEE